MITFLNIKKQDKKIRNIIIKNITKVIDKNNFILGDSVNKFEKSFSQYCKVKYAVSCGNGTDALTMSLKILNLPKNSEVIIPAMTYCSTAFAVINAGLKPVLIDIDSDKPTISLDILKKKINKNTKVIMPVHLYGSVVDIAKIKSFIQNRDILIIDDCSQAHGAIWNKKRVGSLADISCFSLYPGKNLGAYGDAGIITTNNFNYYKKLKNFRNLGSDFKYSHTQIGYNSRLDTIQACILIEKLKNLDKYNTKRRQIAKIYSQKITNKKITKIKYSKGAVYHQFVIMVNERDKLAKLFNKNSIQYGLHYPNSINNIAALKRIFKKMKFINSENLANKCFSLPIDPMLKKSEVKKIIKILNLF